MKIHTAPMTRRQIAYWADRITDKTLVMIQRLASVPGGDPVRTAEILERVTSAIGGDLAARAWEARDYAEALRRGRLPESPAAMARRARSLATRHRGWASARPIVAMVLRTTEGVTPHTRRRLIRQLDRRGSLTRPDVGETFEGWFEVAREHCRTALRGAR